jgi:hypothetical protein
MRSPTNNTVVCAAVQKGAKTLIEFVLLDSVYLADFKKVIAECLHGTIKSYATLDDCPLPADLANVAVCGSSRVIKSTDHGLDVLDGKCRDILDNMPGCESYFDWQDDQDLIANFTQFGIIVGGMIGAGVAIIGLAYACICIYVCINDCKKAKKHRMYQPQHKKGWCCLKFFNQKPSNDETALLPKFGDKKNTYQSFNGEDEGRSAVSFEIALETA